MSSFGVPLGVDVFYDGVPMPDPSEFFGWMTAPRLHLTTTVVVNECNTVEWWLKGSDIVLSLPKDEYRESDAVVAAALFAADRVRQMDCRFLVHGASVATDCGAVLLIGDSGCGKTSVALLMAALAKMRLVSGDLTPVTVANGRACTDGHWKTLRLRATAMQRLIDVGQCSLRVPDEVKSWLAGTDSVNGWDKKKLISPDDLQLHGNLGASPLVAVVDLRVLASTSAVACRPLQPKWRTVSTMYNLMNTLMAGHWMLVDDSGALRCGPLFSTENTLIENRLLTAQLTGEVPAVEVRGPLEGIVSFLLEWLERYMRDGIPIDRYQRA